MHEGMIDEYFMGFPYDLFLFPPGGFMMIASII